MPTIELTDDEMETLRDAFNDVGCDCPGVDWAKFKALGVKLGFWEAEKPPTEEELKRREEFANSPLGKLTKEMFARSNEQLMQAYAKDLLFTEGQQWEGEEFARLRIKLPNDYQVTQKEKK